MLSKEIITPVYWGQPPTSLTPAFQNECLSFIQQIFEDLQPPFAKATVINKTDKIPIRMEFGITGEKQENKKLNELKVYHSNMHLKDRHFPTWTEKKI